MNEDFVPFELAVKLKEKGFREKCLTFYDVEDNVGLLYNTQYFDEFSPCQYTDLLASFNSGDGEAHLDLSDNCIDAPTISQVLKWLREENDVDLVIYPIFIYEAEDRTREYGCNIYARQLNKPVPADGYRNSYEEAALAGIAYVLDNLI